MKNLLLLILFFFCSCTYNNLAPNNPATPCSDQFAYDASTGVCKNCNGVIGFNTVNLTEIRKTKNAECLYLSKMELLLLLGDSVQIPQRLGYNKLINYNFRGSVIDSCLLLFNFITDADLRGTNLTTLQYGYATVTGRIDNFTKVPAIGLITVKGDSIKCQD